jgi:hypothetical protein
MDGGQLTVDGLGVLSCVGSLLWVLFNLFLLSKPGRVSPYVKPRARKIDECTVEVTGSTGYLRRVFHWNDVARAESFERQDDGTTLIHIESGDAEALAEAINISENL